jgi:hypothetical protein
MCGVASGRRASGRGRDAVVLVLVSVMIDVVLVNANADAFDGCMVSTARIGVGRGMQAEEPRRYSAWVSPGESVCIGFRYAVCTDDDASFCWIGCHGSVGDEAKSWGAPFAAIQSQAAAKRRQRSCDASAGGSTNKLQQRVLQRTPTDSEWTTICGSGRAVGGRERLVLVFCSRTFHSINYLLTTLVLRPEKTLQSR